MTNAKNTSDLLLLIGHEGIRTADLPAGKDIRNARRELEQDGLVWNEDVTTDPRLVLTVEGRKAFNLIQVMLDCGHLSTPDGFVMGYATLNDGRRICYADADTMQREEFAEPGRTEFWAYLSSDGKTITTWTGGQLASITQTGVGRSGFYDSKIYFVQAVAPDGSRWYGKNGGPGMSIHIKRAKGSK